VSSDGDWRFGRSDHGGYMQKRYVIKEVLLGHVIVDTITDKSVSPMYVSKWYAQENMRDMIARGDIKQMSYKEDTKNKKEKVK
jgi:hypothetical protein